MPESSEASAGQRWFSRLRTDTPAPRKEAPMKEKINTLWKLVKVELIICIAVPVAVAMLLGMGVASNPNYLPLIMMALLMALSYSAIKITYKLKTDGEAMTDSETVEPQPKKLAYRILVGIIAIIMPLVGLLLNNGLGSVLDDGGGLFGDFSNIWFYIIAVANGIIMLLDMKNNICYLMVFYLKIVGFSYICYFALVFLPVIPVGVVALLAFGLGIFAFVPLAVFVTELIQILQDIKLFERSYKAGMIAAIILGAITIPAVLLLSFNADRINYEKALSYLSSEHESMPAVNVRRMETTLTQNDASLSAVTDDERSGFNPFDSIFSSGESIPIISRAYRHMVQGGKILSLDTSQQLYQIFLAQEDDQPIHSNNVRRDNINIVDINTDTRYNAAEGIYETWVDLEILNESNSWLSEYLTQFNLPDGCFIKDYYLYVGDEKKPGILADKRAALITYNNILRTPRDPGLIYYADDTTIELRVYPFSRDERRKTGFLVWHSQDEVLNIDGHEIRLRAENPLDRPLDMAGISFIPAAHKNGLAVLSRRPQYYFIIDAGTGSMYHEHIRKVQDYVAQNGMSDVHMYALSYRMYDDVHGRVKVEGGYNLPLAIEVIMQAYEDNESWFPVIIAVSDNIGRASEFKRSQLSKRFPESEYYYNLGWDLLLTPYRFVDGERLEPVNAPMFSKALDYHGHAVADNGNSEIIISGDYGAYTDSAYENAFILYGKTTLKASDPFVQVDLVRDSFRQRLLGPYTAFTVLETKEQEESLLALQARILSADGMNAPAPVEMSEPGWLWFVLAAVGLVVVHAKRRRKALKNAQSSTRHR